MDAKSLLAVPRQHGQAPLLQERERFLAHLAQQGSNGGDLKTAENYLFHIVNELRMEALRPVGVDEIMHAGRIWATYRSGCVLRSERMEAGRAFLRVARDWLRSEGMLSGDFSLRYEWAAEYRSMAQSLNRLAWLTIENTIGKAEYFLKWFFEQRSDPPIIVLKDVEEYLRSRRASGWKPNYIKSTCQSLRKFFHYAETRGWCEAGLSHYVNSPRLPVSSFVKKGPTWIEVRRLLRSSRGETPFEIRANAIYICWQSMDCAAVRSFA